MKIAIVSCYKTSEIEKMARTAGFDVASDKPDFVLAYGGDGTILRSEHEYPSTPKIPVKVNRIVNACMVYDIGSLPSVLRSIISGSYSIRKFCKVKASVGSQDLIGLNEVQVHNTDPRKALRFTLKTPKKSFEHLIGDGIVASTAYGSTGYYNVMGYSVFSAGIRIGFNNVRPRLGFAPLSKGAARLIVEREQGTVIADNLKKSIPVVKGDEVLISQSEQSAFFVQV